MNATPPISPKYLFHPFAEELSGTAKTIYLIASIALGFFTLGLIHLGYYFWENYKVSDETLNPTDKEKAISKIGQSALHLSLSELAEQLEKFQQENLHKIPEDQKELRAIFNDTFDNGMELLGELEDKKLRADRYQSIVSELELIANIGAGVSSIEKHPGLKNILWKRDARRLINDKDAAAFEEFIKANKDRINDTFTLIGGTILHELAVKGKPIEFVAILAQYGANFNVQDKLGNTPLLWAIANGHNLMASKLIEFPQNLNLKGFGNTPLMLVIAKGYKDKTKDGAKVEVSALQIVEALLSRGALPNIPHRDNLTALHLAYARRDKEMQRLLLSNKADPRSRDAHGRLPHEMAKLPLDEVKSLLAAISNNVYLIDESLFK